MPLTHWIPVLQGSDGRASCHGASLATLKPVAELDERALILEAQGGSRAAFEELVHRYDRDVLRLALNLMRRSEEHTSELQSPCNLVCRLLLEKKKKKIKTSMSDKNDLSL